MDDSITGNECQSERSILAWNVSAESNWLEFQDKEKHPEFVIFNEFRMLLKSGKRGIRTLETLSTPTRFPVVRLRPAQPSFHMVYCLRSPYWARKKVVRVTGLEPVRRNTRPSNVPVCQFQHTRIHYLIIIAKTAEKVKGIFAISSNSAVCTNSMRKSPNCQLMLMI